MSNPTAFDIADYDTIDYALRDYVQLLKQAVKSEPKEWGDEYSRALAVKRKIRRRAGRLRKAASDLESPPPVATMVRGTHFQIDRDKLDGVQKLCAIDGIPSETVVDVLLNVDRRTADDHHQTFLDQSDPIDIADWVGFIYYIDRG